MFIRLRKSGIAGIISKCAYCSLMTGTRLFFINKSDDVLSRLLRGEAQACDMPKKIKGKLGCSLGAPVLVCVSKIMDHYYESTTGWIWKCYTTSVRQEKSLLYRYRQIHTWSHRFLALWCMEVWPWLSSCLLQAVETCTQRMNLSFLALTFQNHIHVKSPNYSTISSILLQLPLGDITLG